MSWSYKELLRYMSNRPLFYGGDICHIKDAEHSYLAKRFTDSVLKHLDLAAIVSLPFTDIIYSGKGDPCGVLVDPSFCFDDNQISDIMNFICSYDCCDSPYFLFSDYVSFKIESYLLYDFSLSKDYVYLLRKYYSSNR